MTRHALLRTGLCFIFVLTPTPTTTQKCIGHLKFHFVFDTSYYSDGEGDWIRRKLLYILLLAIFDWRFSFIFLHHNAEGVYLRTCYGMLQNLAFFCFLILKIRFLGHLYV